LVLGKQISQDLKRAPKEELFYLLRVKGHTPFQRSIRHSNILVECKICKGKCRSSHYRRDAWYVTVISAELQNHCNKCIHTTVHSDSSSSSGTADNDKPVKRLATGRPPTDNPPKAVTAHADSNATGTECSVCGLVTKDLVHCRNNHAFCIDDFSKFINVDIINYRQRFISNGSRLYCPTCSPQLSTSRRGKDGDFARK
jgi:hypothetical protein